MYIYALRHVVCSSRCCYFTTQEISQLKTTTGTHPFTCAVQTDTMRFVGSFCLEYLRHDTFKTNYDTFKTNYDTFQTKYETLKTTYCTTRLRELTTRLRQNTTRLRQNTTCLKHVLFFLQCAKALVYFDLHNDDLDLNSTNKYGDTPLHLAARWGFGKLYCDSVAIFKEGGASYTSLKFYLVEPQCSCYRKYCEATAGQRGIE